MLKRFSKKVSMLMALVLLFVALFTGVQFMGAEVYAADGGSGYRVFHLGNSYTVGCHFEVEEFAKLAGYTNHDHLTSWSPGCTITGHWNDSSLSANSEGQDHLVGWENALNNYSWDKFFVQPYYEDLNQAITNANNFYDYALSHQSPNAQMIVYMIWPTQDSATWADEPLTNRPANAEAVADGIQNAHPYNPPVVISPVGLVIMELRRLTELGQIPGVSSIGDWYSDGAHLSNLGNYAAGLTHFATIYKANPTNYSAIGGDVGLGNWWGYSINSATAEKIKEVVWNVVSNYSRSGV